MGSVARCLRQQRSERSQDMNGIVRDGVKDRRSVEELSLEELEEVLRVRRRKARSDRLRRQNQPAEGLDPLAPPKPPIPSQPAEHRRFSDVGATARYRPRAVDEPAADADAETSRDRLSLRLGWSWLRDKTLLVVELGILLALSLVLLSSLATLRQINESSSQTSASPTATSAIQVLPGGHAPPDSPGGPAPDEIPPHLRDLVNAVTPLPVPTRGPEQAVRIQIPAIDVDTPVVEGDDPDSLKRGAGHHVGSANPGERGNCIISAHNDVFGEIFRDLPDLSLGDEVLVHTASRVHRYVITQKRIIEPTEVSVMEDTSSPVLTLISCYPYGINTHRIVVIGELES